MKVVVCECGARNVVGGDCILCGRSLGSLSKAVLAAVVAASAMALSWVVTAFVLGAQALWFGALFGVVVSGAVAQVSFGRGWAYQLVASTATLVGIVLGETLLVTLLRDRLDLLVAVEQPNLGLFEAIRYTVLEDSWAMVFAVLGLMGGFWVWKQPAPGEDA